MAHRDLRAARRDGSKDGVGGCVVLDHLHVRVHGASPARMGPVKEAQRDGCKDGMGGNVSHLDHLHARVYVTSAALIGLLKAARRDGSKDGNVSHLDNLHVRVHGATAARVIAARRDGSHNPTVLLKFPTVNRSRFLCCMELSRSVNYNQ